ncbi:MAG: hypothetical protein JXA41_11630 [Deltaproteobacteria bacterium]|nr:hypothetical protein [Deltaproteobacteria bacterium]
MDYFCNGSDYVLTWDFHAVDIDPAYPGVNFRALLPTGQIDPGTWVWNSIGITFTVNSKIPGTISGNTISGRYDSYNGPVCYSGTRQY